MSKRADDKDPKVWFVRVLFLLSLRADGGGEKNEVAFVWYMEFTSPLDEVDLTLGCISVRSLASDVMDYNVRKNISTEMLWKLKSGMS